MSPAPGAVRTVLAAIALSAVVISPAGALLATLVAPGHAPSWAVTGPLLRGQAAASAGPALLIPDYEVVVEETGLPVGTLWSAALNGTLDNSTGASVQFLVPNGTYLITITPIAGFAADPGFLTPTVFGSSLLLAVAFSVAPSNPFWDGMPAALALGQPDLTTTVGVTSPSAGNLESTACAFDPHGDLWVTDGPANRVLEFAPPFRTGMGASLVLGQSGFSGDAAGVAATNLSDPEGIAIDAKGDVWVSSFYSDRVTEFVPPFTDGEAASLILGQAAFGPITPVGHGPTNLTVPRGIAFDSHGDLWVADLGNSRVLEFTPPFSDGQAASLVLGQSTLHANSPGTTAVNMSEPSDVAFDSAGDAWVSEFTNNRVLEFLAPLYTGEAASVVLGQASFTVKDTSSPDAFSAVEGVAVDPRGDVWVGDSGDARVLEFLGPNFTTFETPSLVIGQPNLTTFTEEPGSVALADPWGETFDSSGDLWVADFGDSRVVEYVPAQGPGGGHPAPSRSAPTVPYLAYIAGAVVLVAAVALVLWLSRKPKAPPVPPAGVMTAGPSTEPPPPPPQA